MILDYRLEEEDNASLFLPSRERLCGGGARGGEPGDAAVGEGEQEVPLEQDGRGRRRARPAVEEGVRRHVGEAGVAYEGGGGCQARENAKFLGGR